MAKFHTLSISDIRKETPDTVSIAFDVPVALKSDYQFAQGQYLTLKGTIDGDEIRRSYSICVSPLDHELRVAVKQVPQGVFSTYANNDLKVGDELDVMTPTGNFFTPIEPSKVKNYVLFAAGSGITPIMSIMKTVLEEEPSSTVTLFYGNKKSGNIIFQEQIEDLKNQFTQRLSVNYVLTEEHPGSDLFYGRIDEDKCEKFATHLFDPLAVDAYFLCGPEQMIRTAASVLESKGVNKDLIHFELFTSPSSVIEGKTEKAEFKETAVEIENAEITVILDDETSTYILENKQENILDSAMNQGIDVPYACKGAVCMTCRAKLLEGEASMDKNYALTDQEVEQGYILTCQAHPKTQKVVVSFDD
jgi:ring-1,2-phenylacetyl-CoA epoxidase subunit PaaE